jgi:hypothetical protein
MRLADCEEGESECDALFHIDGRGPFAGEHQGFSGFVELFSKLMGGVDTYRQDVLDVIAGDEHSVGLLTSVTTRGDPCLRPTS